MLLVRVMHGSLGNVSTLVECFQQVGQTVQVDFPDGKVVQSLRVKMLYAAVQRMR